MTILQQLLQTPTRRVVTCTALTLVAVVVVAVWAAHMDGDSSQTAAMLGATIAVTVAATTTSRTSCRPTFLTRGRHASRR